MHRLECLGILEIRYIETLKAVNGDWKACFRSDFLFFELISREKPEQVALALTECDLSRFNNLSVQDFLVPHSKRREEIARKWEILVDDTRVCAMVSQYDLVPAAKNRSQKCYSFNIKYDVQFSFDFQNS